MISSHFQLHSPGLKYGVSEGRRGLLPMFEPWGQAWEVAVRARQASLLLAPLCTKHSCVVVVVGLSFWTRW